MTEVDPRIMNHVRAQLHRNRGLETAAPRQRHGTEEIAPPVAVEQDKTEPRGIKGLLSRFALRAAGPELSGD